MNCTCIVYSNYKCVVSLVFYLLRVLVLPGYLVLPPPSVLDCDDCVPVFLLFFSFFFSFFAFNSLLLSGVLSTLYYSYFIFLSNNLVRAGLHVMSCPRVPCGTLLLLSSFCCCCLSHLFSCRTFCFSSSSALLPPSLPPSWGR